MIYHLFELLKDCDIPGQRLFTYLSFRAIFASATAILISLIFGKKIIRWLQKKQIGEEIRDLGLEGQMQKKGTPTMGGVIIIVAILISVLLFADLTNIYIILLLVTTVWLGLLGFADDSIKVFRHNKEGLSEKAKLAAQVILGLSIGITVCFSNDIVVRERIPLSTDTGTVSAADSTIVDKDSELRVNSGQWAEQDVVKSTKTTIPFVKNHEFDYKWLSPFKGAAGWYCKWAIYVVMIVLVITACSNGTNLTDGMDGLSTGTSAIVGVVLGIAVSQLTGGGIPQHNVYSRHRRDSSIHGRLRGGTHRVPVVQLLSGTGIHGRHRKPGHRRHHRCVRNTHPQGTAAACTLRHLPRREPVCPHAEILFQIYEKTVRDRETNIQNGPAAPSFSERECSGPDKHSEKGCAGSKDCRKILDYRDIAGSVHDSAAENKIMIWQG